MTCQGNSTKMTTFKYADIEKKMAKYSIFWLKDLPNVPQKPFAVVCASRFRVGGGGGSSIATVSHFLENSTAMDCLLNYISNNLLPFTTIFAM